MLHFYMNAEQKNHKIKQVKRGNRRYQTSPACAIPPPLHGRNIWTRPTTQVPLTLS